MTSTNSPELTLDELLADPIVRLVMRRDGVTEADIRRAMISAFVASRLGEIG